MKLLKDIIDDEYALTENSEVVITPRPLIVLEAFTSGIPTGKVYKIPDMGLFQFMPSIAKKISFQRWTCSNLRRYK